MKKTFEIKGVDLAELYGLGDQNIFFLEKSHSGLVGVLNILKNIKDIEIVELNEHDIARHHLVKHIM